MSSVSKETLVLPEMETHPRPDSLKAVIHITMGLSESLSLTLRH